MGVDPERGVGFGVAQAGGDGHGVDVAGEQQRRVGVPELVEGDVEAVVLRVFAEPLAGRVVMHGRTVPVADDPPVSPPPVAQQLRAFLVLLSRLIQQRHHARRQHDEPGGGRRLCVVQDGAGLAGVLQRLGDVNAAALPVDVGEEQAVHLAQAQAA